MIVWDWVAANSFELIASTLVVVSIFLQIKQNPVYWIISLVMVSMYIWLYYQKKIYADMSLQIYYFVVSVYGFFHWIAGKKKVAENEADDSKQLPVSKLKKKEWILSIVASLIAFFIIYWILKEFTDSPVPIVDAFTTSLSFVATWMLARKIIENWLFWIVVDIVSVGLYIYRELYPTAVVFAFLTVMAVIGYLEWKKDLKKEQKK